MVATNDGAVATAVAINVVAVDVVVGVAVAVARADKRTAPLLLSAVVFVAPQALGPKRAASRSGRSRRPTAVSASVTCVCIRWQLQHKGSVFVVVVL